MSALAAVLAASVLVLDLPERSSSSPASAWPGIAEASAQRRRGRRGRQRPAAPAPKAPAPKAPGQQPAAPGGAQAPGKPGKERVFDFTGLDISGQLRAPQLLYFLDRANEELERASLERRSFIPEMVRSIDDESL